MCNILNSLSKILNQRDDGDDVVTQQQQKRKTKTFPPPLSLSLSLSLSPPPPSSPPSTHLICVHLIHIWKASDIVTKHVGKPAKSSTQINISTQGLTRNEH
jgi:hypothetical protein